MKQEYKYYDPNDSDYRCQSGIVERVCKLSSGNVWYNPLEKMCEEVGVDANWTLIFELGELKFCGKYFYADVPNGWGRCQGGVYQEKCDNEWFNVETHVCDEEYSNGNYTNVVKAKGEGKKCGETSYNEETHYCDWNDNTVKALVFCGTEKIWPNQQRCTSGVVEEKCGNGWFNPIKQSCDWARGTVTDKLECK
jgi:hypothetical protein